MLVDLLLGLVVLTVALLAHAGTLVGGSRLAQAEIVRTQAILSVAQFGERLRAEPDFGALYGMVRVLQERDGGPGAVRLSDGRWAYPPTDLFPDFELEPPLTAMWVRVEVPGAPLDADPTGPDVLREDVTDPRFGLPADLDLDGQVDGDARDGDYLVLPAEVSWRWRAADGSSDEERHVVWVRGVR